MKTLTLFLILIGLSVICSGQNTKMGYPSNGTIGSNNTIWNHKDLLVDKPNPQNNPHRKANSAFDYSKLANNITVGSGSYVGNYTFTKLTIEPNGKFTINLDGFKVTDTIWIMAGKRKVGILAYKFLEYFKDEPINDPWMGNGLITVPTNRYLNQNNK